MEALVLYDSVYGSTRRIAQAVGAVLRERYHVRVQSVGDVGEVPESVDLLVIGGPTHYHQASRAMHRFLDHVPPNALLGMLAAAFDTRYPGAGWLIGSASSRIARALKKGGAELLAAPESFFISKDVPPQGEKRRHEIEQLEPGEIERAGEWAHALLEAVKRPVPAGARD
jgi:flavodoxin